jgi:hypothetical protein
MEKEITLTVDKPGKKTSAKNSFEKEIKALSGEIQTLKENLEKKGYIVEGGIKRAETLVDWLTNNAKWKFNESMGVIEAIRQIEVAAEAIRKGKTKELYLPNLCLEAVYYFISKVEGNGLAEAKFYVNELLKPVADGLGRAKVDKDSIEVKGFELASYENGIDPTKEIKAEDIEKI